MLFDFDDVRPLEKGETYNDKFVILKPEKMRTFKKEYQNMQSQLFIARDGFGCDPAKMGNAVFGVFCGDGEHARIERYEILGVATDEALATWKKMYGEPITQ